MADSISQQLRQEVRMRAGGHYEYCLMSEALLLAACEVDHIISRKHGGISEFSNLALSCARCNRNKGTDIGSIHPGSGKFIRLFNPRVDKWVEHFEINDFLIVGRTPIGQVTSTLLRFNEEDRVTERMLLQRF